MLATGARMGGSKISGGGCGCSCGGDDSSDDDDDDGGGSDGKIDADGDRRRLMDAMVKVPSDKFRGKPAKEGEFGSEMLTTATKKGCPTRFRGSLRERYDKLNERYDKLNERYGKLGGKGDVNC